MIGKRLIKGLFLILAAVVCLGFSAQGQIATLRTSLYVFLNQDSLENFHPDSIAHRQFLADVVDWVNYKLGHLDTLKPAVPSVYVPDARVRIRVDTIYFHADYAAWDASVDIMAPYIRQVYIDDNEEFSYRQKYQTLPVFISGNHSVVGGHTMGIGSKWYIAVRGYYHQYRSRPRDQAVEECAKNLIHELGHCLGLLHNFQGGPHGEQCDQCDDNGCPQEGTSNNIMDYWPGFGHAISKCQFDIMQEHLRGEKGDISEVIINDSCYRQPDSTVFLAAGEIRVISDTTYAHADWYIGAGATLSVGGYLSMPIGSSIYLEPGANLEVSGGTIGNLCGELWEGVRVPPEMTGQLPVIALANGGSIEHARVGLWLSSPTILNVNEALFRNCSYSILIEEGVLDDLLIDRSQFLITDRLHQYEEGTVPGRFIDFRGSRSLTVESSRFVNEKGTFVFDADVAGRGVSVKNASLSVQNCEFINLARGVTIAGSDPEQQIRISHNDFIHNRCAVHALTQGILVIDTNNLSLQRFNDRTTYGIVLEQPDRLYIADNQFNSQYGGGSITGILLRSPTATSSLVINNNFQRLPAGIIIDSPPPVDSILLSNAVEQQFQFDELLAGPQLPGNTFEEVTLPVVFLQGSGGTAIGLTGEIPRAEANPLEWRVGGFTWLNDQALLGAIELEEGGFTTPEHGFYLFMNYLNINGVESINHTFDGYGRLSESRYQDPREEWQLAGDYLRKYDQVWREVSSGTSLDLFKMIECFHQTPALLRSGFLAPFGVQFLKEGEGWLQDLLATMAVTFNEADSLLASLAVERARMNAVIWMADVLDRTSKTSVSTTLKATALPRLENLPLLNPQRFARDRKVSAGIPSFRLWPVPAIDYLYIHPIGNQRSDSRWQWVLLDASGRIIRQGQIGEWSQHRLEVGDLQPGVYFIRVANGFFAWETRSFIKI